MVNILLLILAASSFDFSLPPISELQRKLDQNYRVLSEIPTINTPLNEIKEMMQTETINLKAPVINKVITSIKCATEYNVERNNILTVIDYSLPSNEKRLWVFDLNQKKLLFNTYVSHGIRSGTLLTSYFSNKYDSKASSIGVYKTDKSYYGREGLSLRLEGLDSNFNDNANNRSIVMHGGWYMDEVFIKRYGRPGRSWGCPAIPLAVYQPIINTIKDKSLLVAYYPNDEWFGKSKYLTCDMINPKINSNNKSVAVSLPSNDTSDAREPILFADMNNNSSREESEPVLAMAADDYERILHTQAPLSRMLRRQINNAEYIVLSAKEFNELISSNEKEGLKTIKFVVPEIIMVRGYYETQMKILPMGSINAVRSVTGSSAASSYSVSFDKRSAVNVRSTNRFIRWVGL